VSYEVSELTSIQWEGEGSMYSGEYSWGFLNIGKDRNREERDPSYRA
jgi:hypothetical protein